MDDLATAMDGVVLVQASFDYFDIVKRPLPGLPKPGPSQATTQMTWQGTSFWIPQGGPHVAPPSLVPALEEEQSLWSPRGDSHPAHSTPVCA